MLVGAETDCAIKMMMMVMVSPIVGILIALTQPAVALPPDLIVRMA